MSEHLSEEKWVCWCCKKEHPKDQPCFGNVTFDEAMEIWKKFFRNQVKREIEKYP